MAACHFGAVLEVSLDSDMRSRLVPHWYAYAYPNRSANLMVNVLTPVVWSDDPARIYHRRFRGLLDVSSIILAG
jgi:hypothetical protein